jgi:predicted amidohydrolase YtcJ
MLNSSNYHSTHSPARPFDADIVLMNGRIYTVDPQTPWVSAVAIKDGVFIAVGDKVDVTPLIGKDTMVKDLNGAFAMPGLYDMHTHPDLALGPKYSDYLDVGLETPDPDQVKEAI